MAILRIVLVSIICWGMVFYLGREVLAGWKRGMVRHTDSVQVYARQKQPLKYWLIMLFFSAIVLLSIVVWGKFMLGFLS